MMFENLKTFATIIPFNIDKYIEAFPIESQASESVHQGIATLLYNHTKLDSADMCFSTAVILSFGAHSAWINSFNLTVAGYTDTGWSEIRRAIEFTCYASKVINSEDRAKAWIKQRTDNGARKKFSHSCQIPIAYRSEKYRYLRDLLVTYDIANYYGAHGNLETLAGKYYYNNEKEFLFSYTAKNEIAYSVSVMLILNGYRILQAFRKILGNKLTEKKKLDEMLGYIDKTIIKMRTELARQKYNIVPIPIIQNILKDNNEETDRMFNEMLEREKVRIQKET